MPELSRGRMGHVPQRPAHRARHQGAARVWAEQFRENAVHLVKLDPSLKSVWRADGAGQHPGEGVGADRADRATLELATRLRACDRGGADWANRRHDGNQRKLKVHVLDRLTDGPNRNLSKTSVPSTHPGCANDLSAKADIIIECARHGPLSLEVMQSNGQQAIVCLTGISSGSRSIPFSPAELNKHMVLENDVVFGSVNANRHHYEQAAAALMLADTDSWLERVITRRVPLSRSRGSGATAE